MLEELNKNNYINLQEQEEIKQKYYPLYKKIKNYKKPSYKEREFLQIYKNITKHIEQHNEKYFKSKKEEVDILNNINGYPLDEFQKKVVLSNEKATLVVAGAGSGKSLTIIGKIVYLVRVCNVNPEDILCISFTNDATINLKKNIAKNYNFNINIYTFHKLSLELLKQNNIIFQIAPDNFLKDTIDNFFYNILPTNKKFIECLNTIIGKNPSDKAILNLKRLISTFISLFKSNNYDLTYFSYILKKIRFTFNYKEYKINKSIILLTINIYLLYENELFKENAIDFNDMINKSLLCLKENGLKKKWKYIIVDEYQDTSLTKFNLINEILKQTDANFLAVGDDFQSIYRFTGCTLHIFLNFTKYLKFSKIFQIINTYRNPQELINVAGSFIMKNKSQQKKNLISNKHLEFPIKIYYEDNKVKSLKNILNLISQTNTKEIMVLGRNNKDINMYIDKEFTKSDEIYNYKNVNFRYLTIHKSKGLESEVVILINMENTLTGMPTQLKEEKILKYVNNQKEYYKFEEERRLFYVALTRTKSITYILSPTKNKSYFTKEIEKYKKYVEKIKM